MLSPRKVALILVLLTCIAAGFRFWQLGHIPPGLYPDEAVNTSTAIRILETRTPIVFDVHNNGREALFFDLIAVSFSIFGVSMWSFKLVGALAGVLTIPALFFLAREVLLGTTLKGRATQIALLSSLFLATSFWHILLSRLSFRVILMPLVASLAFALLFRAFRTRSFPLFLAGSFFFGLGFYTYISFRVVPLLLILLFAFWLYEAYKRQWIQKFVLMSACCGIVMLLTILPIGMFFLQHPEYISARTGDVSIFSQENPVVSGIQSLGAHLLMFNIHGDNNWRHNMGGSPHLPLVVGIFFLLGIGILAVRAKRVLNSRPFFFDELSPILFLFAWFGIFLLPGVLTYEGIPHSLRVAGVLPVAYLFAGIGADAVLQWIGTHAPRRTPRKRLLVPVVVVFLATSLILTTFIAYFYAWANNPKTIEAYTPRFVDVGLFLNTLPQGTHAYVIKSEGDLPTETSKFIQRTANKDTGIYLSADAVTSFPFQNGDIVVTMNKEQREISLLQSVYPPGETTEQERIWIFRVK